jgi:hypothetical protein
MYGFSIGIIFAPTLAAQEITPNGMRKGFTWVDAGTSIRPQTHAEKDCVNGSGSKGSIAGQRDLIQSQKFARRDTVGEEREKPMIGQREPVFGKQEKRREEKRRGDAPLIIIITKKHSCMYNQFIYQNHNFTTFLTVRSSGLRCFE